MMIIKTSLSQLISIGYANCVKLINSSSVIDLMKSPRVEGDVDWVEVMLLMGYQVHFPYLDLLSEKAGMMMLKSMYTHNPDHIYRLKFKSVYDSQVEYVSTLYDNTWNYRNVYKMKMIERMGHTDWSSHVDTYFKERPMHKFNIQQNIIPTGSVTFTVYDENNNYRDMLRNSKVDVMGPYTSYNEDTELVINDKPLDENMLKRLNEDFNAAVHEMVNVVFSNVSKKLNVITYMPEVLVCIHPNYCFVSVPKCAEQRYSMHREDAFMNDLDLTDSSPIDLSI